jgi:hypothetical protein
MGGIINRDGGEVKVVLYDSKGNRREVGNIKEFGLLNSGELDIRPILIKVIKESLKNFDFYSMFLLFSVPLL